jgi:antitoxin component of RelBE/YafQ-DinJ toxin-antitoxin module
MTHSTKTSNDTEGLTTVRQVCTEYGITRAQAVNIMFQLPVKLQKERANWYAIEDVEDLMERHRYMWDRDFYNRE